MESVVCLPLLPRSSLNYGVRQVKIATKGKFFHEQIPKAPKIKREYPHENNTTMPAPEDKENFTQRGLG